MRLSADELQTLSLTALGETMAFAADEAKERLRHKSPTSSPDTTEAKHG